MSTLYTGRGPTQRPVLAISIPTPLGDRPRSWATLAPGGPQWSGQARPRASPWGGDTVPPPPQTHTHTRPTAPTHIDTSSGAYRTPSAPAPTARVRLTVHGRCPDAGSCCGMALTQSVRSAVESSRRPARHRVRTTGAPAWHLAVFAGTITARVVRMAVPRLMLFVYEWHRQQCADGVCFLGSHSSGEQAPAKEVSSPQKAVNAAQRGTRPASCGGRNTFRRLPSTAHCHTTSCQESRHQVRASCVTGGQPTRYM